jgi:hypothetical protein
MQHRIMLREEAKYQKRNRKLPGSQTQKSCDSKSDQTLKTESLSMPWPLFTPDKFGRRC